MEKILNTSTSETYGTAQYTPIDENHPLVGQSPYSASKIAADQLAISYYRSFDLPVKIVRPFNTYGPRQSDRAIIPTVITQLTSGKNKIQLGNLSPLRDFTFVKDTCNGFIEIYKSDKLYGEATNIGMNKEISIAHIVEKMINLMGLKIKIIQDKDRFRPKKSEVDRLVCNNTKILKETEWKPEYDLEKGLKETIKWFNETDIKYKTRNYNV